MNDAYLDVLYKRHPIYANLFCGDNGLIYSTYSSKFILGRLSQNGYIRIPFGYKGKKMERMSHRLICESHIGMNKLSVNHINGTKTDNRLINLEFVTKSNNTMHDVANGLIKTENSSSLTKTTNEDRNKMREMRISGMTYRSIGAVFGITATHVCAICKYRDRWSKRSLCES